MFELIEWLVVLVRPILVITDSDAVCVYTEAKAFPKGNTQVLLDKYHPIALGGFQKRKFI